MYRLESPIALYFSSIPSVGTYLRAEGSGGAQKSGKNGNGFHGEYIYSFVVERAQVLHVVKVSH